MPQERHDARKLERELKIKFDWREADKNLEKEERNKPLDLNTLPGANNSSASPIDALLALETRSWRGESAGQGGGASVDNGRSSFRNRRKSSGGGRPQGRGNSGSAHPGRNASHPRGGNSGSRPTRGNRGR
jgi:ATP-dependent RNA helicase RhlE